jgi:hypothetical protein
MGEVDAIDASQLVQEWIDAGADTNRAAALTVWDKHNAAPAAQDELMADSAALWVMARDLASHLRELSLNRRTSDEGLR